jgi:ABC-2 type transport system ATP-binding protein
MAAISAHGLTKHYGGGRRETTPTIRALDDVSLEVLEGEIFGFLGPNGSGKSTFIRLLLGFLHATAGRATVLGLDSDVDSVAIRARTGYLPGGVALYDGLTGEGQLDYLAALAGRPSVRRAELCDRLELSRETLRRPIRDYSRGMRQKIGIVQALQHDPELAILDEPSEGLDPLMQRAFYDILGEVRAAGRTVFFSSHVLSEVERVCDRVAVVREGRLVALEDVGTLLARRRRHVEITVVGPPPDLSGVHGVTGLAVEGSRITCSLEGDPAPFLAALARSTIADILIEPARLEDAFLELYQAGAKARGGVSGGNGTAGAAMRESAPGESAPGESAPGESPPGETRR